MSWRHLAALALLAAGALGWWVTRSEPPAPQPRDGAAAREVPAQPDPAPTEAVAQDPVTRAAPEASPAYQSNERGIRALMAGEYADAVQAFERCLELDPGEPVFRGNLAEALARRARALRDAGGALVAALPLVERAAVLAPEREDLDALLERWRREAAVEEDFSVFESHYFELSFDGSRTELLHASQRFLDRLEEAYTDFQEWFGHDPVLAGRPPFPVRLYRRAEFDDLTGLGHWASGAFDGTIRLPLEEDAVGRERWERTLRHELVHAFVDEVADDDVPGWLNEGLAQWLEGDPTTRVAAARARLRGHEPVPLDGLRASLATLAPDELRRAYDQSLALVAHLFEAYGAAVVLELVSTAGDRSSTFERATGVPLALVLGDLFDDL